MENETIFREKPMERVASADQLNDYIKLSNPGLWFILGAVVILLAGACIFGLVGHIDSSVPCVAISDGQNTVCWVKKEYGDRFTEDMAVKIDQTEYPVSLHNATPVSVDPGTDAYVLFLGDMQPGEWIYEIDADGTLPTGSYEARLVTERISPLSFLFGKS
ncbi:MAG: hypothetical protein IJJ13_05120 [Lachnospiraceae bacterium]|nr:hypothetical protein [Lachnospiraceae bacterium]